MERLKDNGRRTSIKSRRGNAKKRHEKNYTKRANSNLNKPVTDKGGNTINNPEKQMEHWKVLNRTPVVEPLDIRPGAEMVINMDPFTRKEIIKAIQKTKNGKAPGPDNIPPEGKH